MSHRVRKPLSRRLLDAVPFGVGRTKPHHYREMLRAAWENRDEPRWAWRVLSQGVCDGCALGVAGFRDWTMDGIHLCLTRLRLLRLNTMPALDPAELRDVGRLRTASGQELRQLGRLPCPMLRERGDRGFRRLTWEEAYERIARRLRATTPERIAFYLTSRGLTNETYYVAQKLARFLGTNNIDNAARLCHSPSTAAMKASLGVAASTCSYRDWYGTDLLLFLGANPANDQPVTMKYVLEAKKLGTRVVVVNPVREPGLERYWVPSSPWSALFGTDIMDYWFGVAQGGDVAFLYGVLKALVAARGYDWPFVRDHTSNFNALRARLYDLDWSTLELGSGLPRSSMAELATLLRTARTAVFVWSMGITQHSFGSDAVQMILNLALARGFIGRERCGVMPIRGHSGVQGGAEMGAYATAFPGGLPINPENARRLTEAWGFPVPDTPGLTATEMVEAASRRELDVLYCVGGNFLRALADETYVAAAMSRVPLRVHQDIVLTDQMLVEPDGEVILLPARTRYEQEGGGTETTTERRVIFGPELGRQLGEARSEWRIFRELAAVVDPQRAAGFGCESAQAVREEIARIVPTYDGIQHLRKLGDQFQWGGPRLCESGRFPTPDGRAVFGVPPLPEPSRSRDTFYLSTRRGAQFNTMVFADTDLLTGLPRDAVLMNPDDMAQRHLRRGDAVLLVSPHGRLRCRVCPAPIVAGNLQVHWPEGNVLLPRDVVDPSSGIPDYNTRVRVEAA